MKHWRSILLAVLALLLVIPLVLMMWPEGPLDLSKDEEPFRSMVLPPKKVEIAIIMDGGSRVMFVTDQRDITHIVSFPFNHDGIVTPFKEAYQGNLCTDEAKIRLKNPARAKAIMLRLFRDYSDKNDDFYEPTLQAFSKSPSGMGKRIYRRLFE